MLGKLMKYEWQSTWKLLVPMNLLIVVMTIFACVTVRIDIFETDNAGVIFSGIMIILTYIASMFVVMVGTAIYLIYRFYTSTYGDQGYLLHTLPVDKHHIIIAKVIVSAAWVLLSSFLMYTSVVFLIASEGELFDGFFNGVESMVEQVGSSKISFFTVVMTLIAYTVGVFARVLKVTACISLGQLSPNHKLLTAFAFYIGVYFAQQIVNAFYYAFLGYVNKKLMAEYYGGSWEYTLIVGLICSVIFYLVTWHIMDKKLNLD